MKEEEAEWEEGLVLRTVSESTAETLCEVNQAADESGLALDDVMRYCHAGLMQTFTVEKRETLYLDEDGLYRLRQIRHLLEVEQVNPEGVRIIVQLLGQLQDVEKELRFLRDR
jgi:DNA-binding transcriptional MerR regulator